MGMYLSAFKTKSDAEQFMQKYQGKVFDWNELVKNFDAIRMGGL
jgi:nitrous oxide reductase accessory protein NosL